MPGFSGGPIGQVSSDLIICVIILPVYISVRQRGIARKVTKVFVHMHHDQRHALNILIVGTHQMCRHFHIWQCVAPRCVSQQLVTDDSTPALHVVD